MGQICEHVGADRSAGLSEGATSAKPLEDAAELDKSQSSSGTLGHLLRAASVSYLSADWLEEVRRAGLSESAKVYDIEASVIREKGKSVRCPRDGRMGAAYVDCLQEQSQAGVAQYMLSYTWGYSVDDIASTLQDYCRRSALEPSHTFVWMCCLCINQHRVRELKSEGKTVSFEDFETAFSTRVRGTGTILCMMAPWHSPVYLTRVWCIFEVFTGIREQLNVEIVMPPQQSSDLKALLLDPQQNAVERLWQASAKVSIQDADATVQDDKDNILKLIRQQGESAVDAMNMAVRDRLETWVVATANQFLGEVESERDKVRILNELSRLLRLRGLPAESAKHLEMARAILKQRGSLASPMGAQVLINIGVAAKDRGDLPGAQAKYDEALEILRQTGHLETAVGAKAFTARGNVKARLGELDGALEDYEASRSLYAVVDGMETSDAATTVANIALVQALLGDTASSLANFGVAHAIRERAGTMHTPAGAVLIAYRGYAQERAGDSDAARKDYEAAREIRSQREDVELPSGLLQLSNLRHPAAEAALAGGLMLQAEETSGIFLRYVTEGRSRSVSNGLT